MAAKSSAKHPFLPMFVGDFMAATAEWEGEEQALYGLLLMHQWALGHLPAEVTKLARLVKWDPRNFERYWPIVKGKFEMRQVRGFGARLLNARLEEHRGKSLAISEKRAAVGGLGARARWQKDGNSHAESAVANATPADGNSHDFANGKRNAIHPIPSHPNPSQVLPPSPPASGSVAQAAPAGSVASKELTDADSVGRVFDHWRQAHNHPRAQLDESRRKVIRHALKRYSEADLCQSLSGYLNSPHHMGENDRNTRYDDIDLLLRDASHIDAGLKFYAEPPRTDLSEKTRRIIRQTEDWEPPEVHRAAE